MVRVSAEHRDVAVKLTTHVKGEAETSRSSERRMFWLIWQHSSALGFAVCVARASL
jgi:hypothetical protein